jgi:hypothetical protein
MQGISPPLFTLFIMRTMSPGVPMTSPTVSAHDLIVWLNDEILIESRRVMEPAFATHPAIIRKAQMEKVKAHVRYMQTHGDEYRKQLGVSK